MGHRLTALFFIAASLAALSQTASTPTIRTGAQIVIVDVNVMDAQGRPVRNLKESAFRILENGAPQTISNFEEHSAPATAEPVKAPEMPKLGPNVYTDFTPTSENAPLNLLLFDSLNTPAGKQLHARQQLVAFLKTMKPGTRLAVFSLTTRLSMLQGFTSDPQALLAALSTRGSSQQSPMLPDPAATTFAEALADNPDIGARTISAARQSEAQQGVQEDRIRAVTTLAALNQLAHYLSGLPGRKNLIWYSGSFPLNPFDTAGSFQANFRETMNLLARSEVAVYPVDSRGLATTPLSDVSAGTYALNGGAQVNDDLGRFAAEIVDEHAVMQKMAEATGGKAYTDVNDLSEAVDKALDRGCNYYTLVYTPANERQDGSYRKIVVHLSSGNYKLAYQSGYDADNSNSPPKGKPYPKGSPDGGAAGRIDAMRAAMRYGAPAPSELLFKAVLVGNAAPSGKLADGNTASPRSHPPYRIVTVAYAANPGDISMPQGPDGTRRVGLEFIAVVYNRDGEFFTRQTNTVNVFAKPEAIQQFLKEGVRYQQQISVPAKGEYWVRVGIQDLIGDKVGAIEAPAASIADMPAASR
ncbi:MAG TPA: VWA domain-containing protein [Acidobacteriaceae bacterium]|nr:VWA domain-containing protein [Acidobacteriaceae bacterium]